MTLCPEGDRNGYQANHLELNLKPLATDFLPTASLATLVKRSKILRQIRDFFHTRGFLEVDTPLLSQDTCVDRHLHPIPVSSRELMIPEIAELPPNLWLQTSPEFGMKRILASGADAIYQVSKSFRAGERGQLHNPEFTMLEWYRVNDDLQRGIDLLADFVEALLPSRVEPGSVNRISYRELFLSHLEIDPFAATIEHLRTVALDQAGFPVDAEQENQDPDFWLNWLLCRIIEPQLQGATIVYDWPVSQSALAIVRTEPFPVAERFELYVDGIEIANGYHELLDANELAERMAAQNQWRVREGYVKLPENSRLLGAMQHGLPGCAGVALGVDRLVMLATDASSIDEVITFPIERA